MQTHATPKNRQEENRLILIGVQNDHWAHTRSFGICLFFFLFDLKLLIFEGNDDSISDVSFISLGSFSPLHRSHTFRIEVLFICDMEKPVAHSSMC